MRPGAANVLLEQVPINDHLLYSQLSSHGYSSVEEIRVIDYTRANHEVRRSDIVGLQEVV